MYIYIYVCRHMHVYIYIYGSFSVVATSRMRAFVPDNVCGKRLCADMSAVSQSRHVCCVAANISAVSHNRHVSCATRLTCLLCVTADVSAL